MKTHKCEDYFEIGGGCIICNRGEKEVETNLEHKSPDLIRPNDALLAELLSFIRGHLCAKPTENIVIPKDMAETFLSDYYRYNKDNA